MHSEMGPVCQNPTQRTVRTAHLSELMTQCTGSTVTRPDTSTDNHSQSTFLSNKKA